MILYVIKYKKIKKMDNSVIIDGNSKLIITKDYSITEHIPNGMILFNPATTFKYFEAVANGMTPDKTCYARRTFIRTKTNVANLNLADFLIKNPQYVPEVMKKENENGDMPYFYFMGTECCIISSYYVPRVKWNKETSCLELSFWWDERLLGKGDKIVAIA